MTETETYGAALTDKYIYEEMDGPEDRNLRLSAAKQIIARVLRETAIENSAALGEIRYENQIHQTEGPMLVGEADVVFHHSRNRLTDQVSGKELILLRDATRRAWKATHPKEGPMTDQECDTMINSVGVKTIENMLKAGLDQ